MKDFTKGFITGAISGCTAIVIASIYKVHYIEKGDIHLDKNTIKDVGDSIAEYANDKLKTIDKKVPRPGDIVEIKIVNKNKRKINKARRIFIK